MVQLAIGSAGRISSPAATRAGQGRAHLLDTLSSTLYPYPKEDFRWHVLSAFPNKYV